MKSPVAGVAQGKKEHEAEPIAPAAVEVGSKPAEGVAKVKVGKKVAAKAAASKRTEDYHENSNTGK